MQYPPNRYIVIGMAVQYISYSFVRRKLRQTSFYRTEEQRFNLLLDSIIIEAANLLIPNKVV